MRFKQKYSSLIIVIAILFISYCFTSCEKKDNDNNIDNEIINYGILPESFKIDIPSSLSTDAANSVKSAQEDPISGDEIYELLNLFIGVGEEAGNVVEDILEGLYEHNIESITEITYSSPEDAREKRLIVTSDALYDNSVWEYKMTVTDILSESQSDSGICMQLLWNNDPVEGIAILKPYNINRIEFATQGDALYKIEYSESGNSKYDEYMVIEIADHPLTTDVFSVDNLKMFVGKTGDVIDVYGNSNHPKGQFNVYDTSAIGFNWAFVASCNEAKNIAVAEIGLPKSSADISTRVEILEDNSVKTVIKQEIVNSILDSPGNTQTEEQILLFLQLSGLLTNLDAPGYFDKDGFIKSGTSPGSDYDIVEERILYLTPYSPADISSLKIEFVE